jgi:hypothetical protein
MRLPVVENTLSLLTPFLAYLPAAWIGASGVLSVVVVGLYLGRLAPGTVSASTRVQGEAMWSVVQFLLESFIFRSVRDRDRHGANDAEHRTLLGRDGASAEQEARGVRRLRAAMIAAERGAVIALRDRGVIGDEVLRRVQRDLDLETMLLEADEDGAPPSPY